jgi:hypothetical protein
VEHLVQPEIVTGEVRRLSGSIVRNGQKEVAPQAGVIVTEETPEGRECPSEGKAERERVAHAQQGLVASPLPHRSANDGTAKRPDDRAPELEFPETRGFSQKLEQLAFILDGRNWFGIGPEPPDAYNIGLGVGAALPWNPSAAYEFLDNLDLIKSDPLSTLEAVIEWGTVYTRHFGSGDAPAWVGTSSTSGVQPVSSISYPLEGFDHIVNGCQGGAAFYVSILRIINIPAKTEWTPLSKGSHMRPSFPSVDLSMPHADNVFHPYFGNGRAAFGLVSDIFYTGAEMDTLFLNPMVDCNGSDCNTVGEQASHNAWTSERLRCADTLCDKLMSDYISFGPDHVRNVTLAIPGGITPASDFAFPLFTTAEQDAIIADIEAYLTLLGSGDIELGKTEYDLRGAHPD